MTTASYLDGFFTGGNSGTDVPTADSIVRSPTGSQFINDGWLSSNIARIEDIEGGDGLTKDPTIRTTSFAAAVNTSYQISNTGFNITILLPASPVDQDRVELTGVGGGAAFFTVDPNTNDVNLPLSTIGFAFTAQGAGFHLFLEYRTVAQGGQDRWECRGDEVALRFIDGGGTTLTNAVMVSTPGGLIETTQMPVNTLLYKGDAGDTIEGRTFDEVSQTKRSVDAYCCARVELEGYTESSGVLTSVADEVLSIDGVTPTVNSLVLLPFNDLDSGVYTVTSVGSGSTQWVLTQVHDAVLPGQSACVYSVENGQTFARQLIQYDFNLDPRFKVLPQPLIDGANVGASQTIRLFRTHNVVGAGPYTLDIESPDFDQIKIPEQRIGIRLSSEAVVTLNAPAGCLLQDPWTGTLVASLETSGEGSFYSWIGRSNAEGELNFYLEHHSFPTSFIATSAPGVSTYSGNFTASPNTVNKVTVTGGAVTVTLPTAASAVGTYPITVKVNGTATNPLTIQADGAELIDGSNTLVLNTDNEWATLISDGTSWSQIG